MTQHARTSKAIKHLLSLGYEITPPPIVAPVVQTPASAAAPFKGNVGSPRPLTDRAEAVKGK
jgi:hypothetical protein